MSRLTWMFKHAVMLGALVLLIGCGKPVELKPSGSFQLNYRPVVALSGPGSRLPWLAGDDQQPAYQDIDFFPVTRANAFAAASRLPRRLGEGVPDLSGIDFKTHFAFLVAHPDPNSYGALTKGQHAFYFSDVAVSYGKDAVVLHLSAGRLGKIDSLVMLTGAWRGDIYTVERRGRQRLEVQLDGHHYQFSLGADAGA